MEPALATCLYITTINNNNQFFYDINGPILIRENCIFKFLLGLRGIEQKQKKPGMNKLYFISFP